MVARSFGQLEQRPGRAWMDLFYTASSRPGFMERLDPMGAERIIWGLASMGCKPRGVWLEGFYVATEPLLLGCNVLNLCGMAWGLGQMGVTPLGLWMERFAAVFDQRLMELVGEGKLTGLRRSSARQVGATAVWRPAVYDGLTGASGSRSDDLGSSDGSRNPADGSGSSRSRGSGGAGWRQKLGLGGQVVLLRALYALERLHPPTWRKWKHLGVLLEQ